MPRFRIVHGHAPDECGASLASWQGFASPLRKNAALASCAAGQHQVWWDVEAPDAEQALALLPEFIRARTDVQRVEDLPVP
ncbi:hypothetical protein ACJ5H2_04795 [Nocardioides sp. R1-1]|uniref:hypothetical protein n=1 Tax=Nocardioides sp. R1-1 TaxID=3383502 RepID=UPI0038D0ACED